MILVFGGNGQLGQELCLQARLAGVPLQGLSRIEGDITSKASIKAAFARHHPDIVINCAAYTAVDRAESEEALAARINCDGVRHLGEACATAKLPLVHISTDYVFDGLKTGPYVESDVISPVGAYGRTKAAGEAALRESLAAHVILRTSWVYGAFGNNFLKTMLRLALERDDLAVVADQHGCPTATPSLARAILAIAPRLVAARKAADESLWGTYHLAGSEPTTWHGFCQEIVAEQAVFTNRRPAIRAIGTVDYPTPARRPPNSVLESGKFHKTFGTGCRPRRDELRETVASLEARKAQS